MKILIFFIFKKEICFKKENMLIGGKIMDYILEKQLYEKVSQFSHDAFVHYLLINHSEIRNVICQVALGNEKIISTEIVNGELYGDFNISKRYVLDVVAKDEKGNIYNIEMQCYRIEDEEMIRFQAYGFRIADTEIKKGKNYSEAKPIKQIIINASSPVKNLNHYIHHFVMFDTKHNVSMPDSMYEVFLIQLAYLDMKEKNPFNQIMYLLKTGKKCDIIDIDRLVEEAIEMHERYMSSDEMIVAIQRERDEFARNTRELKLKRQTEEALKKAQNNVMKAQDEAKKAQEFAQKAKDEAEKAKDEAQKAKEDAQKAKKDAQKAKEDAQKAKDELIKAKDELDSTKDELRNNQKEVKKQGVIEGSISKSKEMIINYVKSKFKEDIGNLIENLTNDTLLSLEENIFNLNSLDEIKEIIK